MAAGLELVGRRSEFEVLEDALAGVGRGESRTIEVVGEPGIGKSRLLAEAVRIAAESGALAFDGVAAEFERDLPFGVFVDALDPYLGSVPGARLRGLGEEQSRRVAAVFPALADLAEPLAGLGEERYRTYHAVRALIELLAVQRPSVLCLDDAHWADQASLELIGHLLRRPPAGPVLLILAFRPRRAPALLASALEAARRAGRCRRLELAPLTREEAGELLGGSLRGGALARIYEQSGGNPFYLEQLARAGTRTDAEVPRSVQDALAHELESLSAPARKVIQAAAIAGERFSPDLVAAVANLHEEAAVAAIDRGVALGLLKVADSPREFRFRHPIVRAAVYESSGGAWRSAAHARAAAALGAMGAPASARAEHVARSARLGDEGAIAVLAAAGHETAALAPATSARWFQAALDLLPAGRDDKRLELLVPLTRALGSAGRLEESRRALGELLGLLPPELSGLRPRILGFIALIDRLLGHPGAGRELLERALAELPDPSTSAAVSLQIELASDRFFVGDWAGMRDWAAPAHALARELGNPGLLATATAVLALAEYSVDNVREAASLMDEAERLVDGGENGDPAARLDAFDWLSWCELSMERYDQALAHLETGLGLGRATGQGHLLMTMRFGVMFAKTWQGRLDEALEASDATIELARLSGSPQLMSWALALRCWLILRAGSVEEALELGEESRRLASSVTPNPFSLVGAGWLAEARVEAGAPAAGRDELLEVLGGPELPKIERAFRPYLYDVLVTAELALGRPDAAAAWAERATDAVGGIDLPGRRAFALRANAAVALAGGRPREAAALALEAAELAGTAHRIEAARCRALAGRALGEAGDHGEAAAILHAARVELEACGAARYRDLATRDLRRLGERIGRPGRRGGNGDSGLASLSARELEVARLVTDRLTNREIAERLVLSQKTVERHMEHIFRKLGVSSRVDVARAVEASEKAGV